MLNEIKSLQPNDRITIDDSRVIETAGTEEFLIDGLTQYELEDGDITFVSINGYYVVGYQTSDTERHFFYEIYYEGSEAKKYLRKDEFVKSFKICLEETTTFKVTEESPLVSSDQDTTFSQYKSDGFFDAALLEKHERLCTLYMGFEIEANALLI